MDTQPENQTSNAHSPQQTDQPQAYRQTFGQIFRVNDNHLEVLRKVKIGGITLEPGEHIDRGVQLAGVDFYNYPNSELEGNDTPDGAFNIRTIWQYQQ